MQIKKRSLPQYILLNCLTLGIYGFTVSKEIGNEINALCKGDGEQPKYGYCGAVMLRGIATALGLLIGLIVGFVAYKGYHDKALWVILSMLSYGVISTVVGSLISGIYLKYWWYKQANRLKLNANRYDLTVREGGTDNLLFHTAVEALFLPITLILVALSLAIPAFILWLITLADSYGAYVFAVLLSEIVLLLLVFFGTELTTGSNFAMYFMFKNLNRFADVCRNGGAPFDPMGYEYYPSCESTYPNFLSKLVKDEPKDISKDTSTDSGVTNLRIGSLFGISGACEGYNFELISGEEIIIGKDAREAMVVIDPRYREISRKHVGVRYDALNDEYCVTDYSSNGTWANGVKLASGRPTYLPHGSELKLANDKTKFRLG